MSSHLATTAQAHAAAAAWHLRRADERLKDAVAAYWRAGRELIEAKDKAGHGQWLPLLKAERIHERTARRAMQCARKFDTADDAYLAALGAGGIARSLLPPKSDTVSDLPVVEMPVLDVPDGISESRWLRWRVPGYDDFTRKAEALGYPSPGYVLPQPGEEEAAAAFHDEQGTPRLEG